MLLMPKNQQAQPLQCEILSEIGMSNSVLLVLFNDLLPVIRFVSWSCIYNEFYLILNFNQEFVPVRLPLDKLNGVSNQLH